VQYYSAATDLRDWSGIWIVSAIVSSVALVGVLVSRRIEDSPPRPLTDG
jgi:hypothetical protein